MIVSRGKGGETTGGGNEEILVKGYEVSVTQMNEFWEPMYSIVNIDNVNYCLQHRQ